MGNTGILIFSFNFVLPLSQKRAITKGEEAIPPQEWIATKVNELENCDINVVHIPKREGKADESVYKVQYLYSDQKRIVAEVMSKLQEWIEADDLSNFQPLRMTVTGAGGSGRVLS